MLYQLIFLGTPCAPLRTTGPHFEITTASVRCVSLCCLSQIYEELDEVKREIKPLVAKLGCSLKGILQETFLETFMLREHWISLHRPLVPVSHVSRE